MIMEDQEKLRKRQREQDEHHEADANGGRPKAGSEVAAGGATTPSSEEVEEFFEILRRMHVAVRYFDKRANGGGEGRNFSRWLREELETGWMESAAAAATTSEEPPPAAATEKIRVIDLNSEPDQGIDDGNV